MGATPKCLAPIFLVGATATGKSAFALTAAREKDGAILAMDAMQVYRGADLGTGKPTMAEQGEVPHGGLDLVEFGESFDVARYLKEAERFLRVQAESGRQVFIVGGTGLYFRALTHGLCEAPQGPPERREELNALSTDELRERLRQIDPGLLDRVDKDNPRRLIRAIEVMETTGRSLGLWQDETPAPLVRDFTAHWLDRPKAELETRIEARVAAMFAAGWEDEVRELVSRLGPQKVRAFAGIGYREIAQALSRGKPSREEADVPRCNLETRGEAEAGRMLQKNIVVATRQYAKRQLTWFRREPKLRKVMLSGDQPLSAALPFLL